MADKLSMNNFPERLHHMETMFADLIKIVSNAVRAEHKAALTKLIEQHLEACKRFDAFNPADARRERILEGWAERREFNKLFLFEYRDEEPRRVDYEEASKFFGLAPATLRSRISTSPSRSLLFIRQGRAVVLAKTPAGLEPALNSLAEKTSDYSQRKHLSPRPKDYRVNKVVSLKTPHEKRY